MNVPFEAGAWTLAIAALLAGAIIGAAAAALARRRERDSLVAENIRLQERLGNEEKLRAEREQALQIAQERIAARFDTLAGDTLRKVSDDFLRLARQSLGTEHEKAHSELGARQQAVESLIKPIHEALKRTDAQIRELEKAREQAYGSIHAQLVGMSRTQEALQLETRNLVSALRRPEVRGQWGEITLRRLVELAGMVEHCDFVEQGHTPTDEGPVRPDLIVHMPEARQLVVDVKTPLDAYLDAVNAADDQRRDEALRRHAARVAERVRELATKAYWSQFPRAPEFVILFIPGDQFLSAALDQRPSLLDDAMRQQVILATPSSLVALLKTVAYGWRQMALAENAEQIRRLAVDLHDRLGTFTGHLARVGTHLRRSVETYNQAVGSLDRMVLPGARRFTELGVQGRKDIVRPDDVDTLPRSTPAEHTGDDSAPPPGHTEAPARRDDPTP